MEKHTTEQMLQKYQGEALTQLDPSPCHQRYAVKGKETETVGKRHTTEAGVYQKGFYTWGAVQCPLGKGNGPSVPPRHTRAG